MKVVLTSGVEPQPLGGAGYQRHCSVLHSPSYQVGTFFLPDARS